jgi:hypothetical protein
MATYGSFETEREVYSGPAYTVYSARKAGEAKADYAVKVYSLYPTGVDAEAANEVFALISDIEDTTVQRVAIQEKAAAGSANVAPVLESGKDETGVWYVTRFYPRSVNRIISGRVAISREALHHIMRSIVQGARDIKRICGRSHGEILPTNVQISRSEKLSEAEVVLSDPLPGGEEEAGRYERGDLHSIGQILLQLVRQREITDEHEYLILPILMAPEWQKLFGKDAERWLAICNQLLDPELSPAKYSLDTLATELEGLQPKPPVSRRTLIFAAAAAVVVIIAGFFILHHFGSGSIVLTSDPPGASIKLDGATQPAGKTPLKLSATKGSHQMSAEFPGLQSLSAQVNVPGGGSVPQQFQFTYGRVQITSTPAGASVKLGADTVGTTPYTSPALAPTQQVYTVELADHRPASFTVDIPPNRQTVPLLTNLIRIQSDDGIMDIASVPSGAIVKEGNNTLGKTRLRTYLSAGQHTLTAQYEDWPPLTTNITVVAGANPEVAIRIPYGTIRFDVTPPDADITLNDKPLGHDISSKVLFPGTHTVQATRTGFKPSEKLTVTIAEGRTTNIVFRLEPMLGFVVFDTEPRGAEVFLAGPPEKKLGDTRLGPLRTNFPPGKYSFVARYEGLDEVRSQPVDVAMGANIALPLAFKFGLVRFETDPPGAEVTVAGKTYKTPFDFIRKPDAAPAPVPYTIKLADYDPVTDSAELAAGKTNRIAKPLSPVKVPIALTSDPPGAQFYLADNQNAVLPATNGSVILPWGTHNIVAKFPATPGLPALDQKSDAVQVDKAGKSEKKFSFSYATVKFTNDADVVLSYRDKQATNPVTDHLPATLYLRPDTEYNFEIQMDDFHTNLQPIKLAANTPYTPPLILPEARKPYTNSLGMVFIRVGPNLYAGQFEVTEQQFTSVLSLAATNEPLLPVVNVTVARAKAFCESLSAKDGELKRLEAQKLAGWKYALPTEADWKAYAEPSLSQAVLDASLFTQSGLSAPAAIDPNRKSAAKIGIYDVFGNAAEWCLASNNQWITMGGSVANRRPRPENALNLRDGTTPQDGFARNIGFRAVLKKP